MTKSTTLTLKIVGNEDYSDIFPKAELSAAQRELIRSVAVMAVEEYISIARLKTQPTVGTQDRIMRLPEVIQVTGLSRASIYSYIKEGSFPKQMNLGARSVGWKESQISEWLKKR